MEMVLTRQHRFSRSAALRQVGVRDARCTGRCHAPMDRRTQTNRGVERRGNLADDLKKETPPKRGFRVGWQPCPNVFERCPADDSSSRYFTTPCYVASDSTDLVLSAVRARPSVYPEVLALEPPLPW